MTDMAEQSAAQMERYPADVPNDVCRHAIVSGLLIENSPGFKRGDLIPLMRLPLETIYVWTGRTHAPSSIVSEVALSVKTEGLWRNAGHLFKMAQAYASFFEVFCPSYDYHWIYRFDPTLPLDRCEFLSASENLPDDRFVGNIEPVTFFRDMAPVIDLLVSDEKFYTAASQFLQSVEFHWCCFACELQQDGHRMHPSEEPRYWEQASVLARMDSAIVQACRSAEGILGHPGKDRGRVCNRWERALGTDPTQPFFKTGDTLIDFYYSLFNLRNGSAHSYGAVEFQTSRRQTIEAQCFALLVLDAYAAKHSRSIEEACEALGVNKQLMDRVEPDVLRFTTDDE